MPLVFPGLNDLQKLEMRMRALERTVESLQGDLGKANKKIEELGRKSKGASGGVASLAKGLIAAAAAFLTVQKAAELAGNAIRESVARDSAEQSLSLLSKSYGEVADAQLLVERSAKKFGQSQTEATKAIATTYARLRPLGATLTEIESVYNGFNTAARLSGASASESAGAFRQLTQALGSGALRGDEFNSIAEQAPLLLQAVSKETGVAVGALRDYAAEGSITSDVVVRALERIEKEGAAGLAEALETPQQAFVDLQNAAEDLNVEVGRILQPAVLEFVRALTEQFRQMTAEIDKTRKAAEFLTEKLGFLAEAGNAVAGAFDGMGISFAGFVSTLLKNLPVIGSTIQMLEKLKLLRDNLAQAQDNSKGGRNFGADYAAQEKALFAAAGGFSPYKEGGGIASQFGGGTKTKGGSNKKSGVSAAARAAEKAAKEAEREAERVADTLRSREQLLERLEAQVDIQKATAGFDKLEKEAALEVLEINQKYDNLLQDETNELIIQNTERARALELEMQLADAQSDRFAQAQKEFTAFYKKEQEANAELTKTEELLKGAYDTVANGLTSGIQGLIDGTKEWGDVLSDILGQLGQMFLNAGFNGLGKGLKIPGYADGGRPPTGEVSVVGERGPELFVPDQAGTVIPNDAFDAATAALSRSGGGGGSTESNDAAFAAASTAVQEKMSIMRQGQEQAANNPQPIDVRYQATVINNETYVTAQQFQAGMSKTANQARAQTLKDLRNKPAARSRAGVS